MNLRAVIVVVFLVVSGISLSIFFRQQTVIPNEQARQELAAQAGVPVPAKSGPQPKAVVVGETTHDFGMMELGQKGEHSFELRNEGETTLELIARKEDHSCQCTLGSVSTNGLKPGESTTVKLTWEVKNPANLFQHWAKIRTNDPKNAEIMFRVKGIIGRRLVAKPGSDIPLGLISEGKVVTRKFTIHSELLDHFEFKTIEASSPLITIEHRPMTEDERRDAMKEAAMEMMNSGTAEEHAHHHKPGEKHDHKEAEPPLPPGGVGGGPVFNYDMLSAEQKAKLPKAKCGYEITLTMKPEMAIGKFRETVTFVTDLESNGTVVIGVEGSRPGPLQILATPGIAWSPEEALLRLPRFSAKEGRKAKLLLFLNKKEEAFEVLKTTTTPPSLKFSIVKDEKFKGMGREKFDILIEVPAGDIPASFGPTNRGSIEIETTHPDIKNLRLELEYTSF